MQIKALAVYIGLFLYSNISLAQNFNMDRIPRLNNFYIGLGPSFIYSDNGGGVRNLEFKIRPSASISYGRKINSFLEVKGTVGFQMLKSQSLNYFPDSTLIRWNKNEQAVGMKGTAYHAGVMPIFYFIPFDTHIGRTEINFYAGIGIGLMGVNKEEVKIINNQQEVENNVISIPYIPIRGGLSYRIGPHSDLAFEATFLTTFSDEIDGNVSFNR